MLYHWGCVKEHIPDLIQLLGTGSLSLWLTNNIHILETLGFNQIQVLFVFQNVHTDFMFMNRFFGVTYAMSNYDL